MKRLFSDVEPDDPIVRIKLDEGDPVEVPLLAVQLFSACARALPPDTEEWDLSGLRIDGSPVSRAVMRAWLQHLAQLTDGTETAADDQVPLTAELLYQLLAFADAVGSRRGLLLACVSQLDGLQLQIKLEKQQLVLDIDQGFYYIEVYYKDTVQLEHTSLGSTIKLGHSALADNDDEASILQQVSSQLEQLLFVAYKLDLGPLIDKLHAFIRINTVHKICIVRDVAVQSMFSARVLAALSVSKHAQKVWSSSMHGEPCSFRTQDSSCLLEPVDLTWQQMDQMEPLKFEAKLQRDWMGMPKGRLVSVSLDLFKSGTLEVSGEGISGITFYAELRLSDVNVDPE